MLGIISNRFCDGNRGSSWLEAVAARQADVIFAAPDARAELPEILNDFAERGIMTLAVDGGDGTIRDVLSAWPADRALPALALFPSGKTNVIARDVGSFVRGTEGFQTLLEQCRRGTVACETTRRCLEIRRPDGSLVVRGFLFGAGVFTRATLFAGGWAHERGIKQRSAVGLVVLRAFLESLAGRPIADPIPLSLSASVPQTPHFLVLATTLEKLMLGLWPFSRDGNGPLKWLSVEAPPKNLTRTMWEALRGNVEDHPERGCRTGRTSGLSLVLQSPFVVDGEVFEPSKGGLLLQAGQPIRFYSVAYRRSQADVSAAQPTHNRIGMSIDG